MATQVNPIFAVCAGKSPVFVGTGFAVHQDDEGAYMLTCAHILRDYQGNISIQGRKAYILPGAEGESGGIDLAVIKVPGLFYVSPLELRVSNARSYDVTVQGWRRIGDRRKEHIIDARIEDKASFDSDLFSARYYMWRLQKMGEVDFEAGIAGSPVMDPVSGYVLGVTTFVKEEITGTKPNAGSVRKDAVLRQSLSEYFNDSELRDLCVDLEIDYESLGGSGKESNTRELVAYVKRRGLENELLRQCEKHRPNVDWFAVLQFRPIELVPYAISIEHLGHIWRDCPEGVLDTQDDMLAEDFLKRRRKGRRFYQKAKRTIAGIYRDESGDPFDMTNIGIALEEVISDLENAIIHDYIDIDVFLELGRAFERRGDLTSLFKAFDCYTAAIQLRRGDEIVHKARKNLCDILKSIKKQNPYRGVARFIFSQDEKKLQELRTERLRSEINNG